MSAKKLVIFFSLTGRTRLVAKAIAKEIGADLEEIVSINQYPIRGAWLYVFGGLQALLGKTPPIKRLLVDLDDYDTVFVGSPVWAGRMAPPVRTFLSMESLEGKTVACFCSFGGGKDKCMEEMKELISGEIIGELGVKMAVKVANDSLGEARAWASSLSGQ